MYPRRGFNLGGRYRTLSKIYVKPEPPRFLELIWGGDEPSFGLTFMPDGTTLQYPISYPHLNPDRQQGDAVLQPDPPPEPPPVRKRERQTFSGDPVLYHHLTKFEKLITDPPLWETWSQSAPIREGPPMIDNQGYLHSR
jgi:hypothetical protein